MTSSCTQDPCCTVHNLAYELPVNGMTLPRSAFHHSVGLLYGLVVEKGSDVAAVDLSMSFARRWPVGHGAPASGIARARVT